VQKEKKVGERERMEERNRVMKKRKRERERVEWKICGRKEQINRRR
jgi:hypothetical protein